MTAKEYLMQYRRLSERIRQLDLDIMMLEAEADSVSVDYSGMPHGSGIADKTANTAIRLATLKQEKVSKREEAILKREEILNVINRVEDTLLSQLLYDRYILFMTWDRVAEDCEKSDRWCRTRLHSRALKCVSKILDNSL